MNAAQIAASSVKDLLAFYNKHSGGAPLVKFQNRESAEKRVRALIANMEAKAAAKKSPSDAASKPYQGAKAIVADCIARGITARKDIIAAGLAAGIKYNTIDGAHYTMCVKKS